jgi:hypothetical protein
MTTRKQDTSQRFFKSLVTSNLNMPFILRFFLIHHPSLYIPFLLYAIFSLATLYIAPAIASVDIAYVDFLRI